MQLPDLGKELVNALDKLYPEKCPHIMDMERTIWMYAGARELVRKLRIVYEQQQKREKE